jgi:SAM-dependent methyltransferase
MHDTARAIGKAFFAAYTRADDVILDVGSLDVNGTLRDLAIPGSTYLGIDIAAGPNVDMVIEDAHKIPLPSNRYSVVVSSSCFEHDDMFWLTFAEMARVLSPGGFMYINVPSNGPVHQHPIDCWRFYPDAGKALAKWSKQCGHEVTLVESFLGPRDPVGWIDFVAVFGKPIFAAPIRPLAYRLK